MAQKVSLDALLTKLDMHMQMDDERNKRIENALVSIDGRLTNMDKTLDDSMKRVHKRIDGAEESVTKAWQHAEKAHSKFPAIKLWVIVGALTAAGTLIALGISLASYINGQHDQPRYEQPRQQQQQIQP